jgi:hypothetical protein
MSKPLMSRYPVGAVVQRRNGVVQVKTEKDGFVSKARLVAANSSKVVGGGQDLQPGWRVMHLDMSTHGEEGHDDPSNLAVIKCRTYKFVFLKLSRILKLPKVKMADNQLRDLVIK